MPGIIDIQSAAYDDRHRSGHGHIQTAARLHWMERSRTPNLRPLSSANMAARQFSCCMGVGKSDPTAEQRHMPPITYCDDEMMAYRSARKTFQPGERVVFDEGYRLAHLPLVNAGHPAVISEVDGRDYRNGTYEKTRYALVMPISADAFLESDQVQALELAIKSSSFAPKIAWELCERRRLQLHATLAGGVPETDLDRYAAVVQDLLDRIGSISVCLKGPFLGTRNTGRIYFPVYPQKIRNEDAFALVQKSIGVSATKLYLVGYYHMRNELDPLETTELAELIDQWRDRIVVRTTIPFLELLATNDDLALSARTHAKISARGTPRVKR
ncbi:hypothetical protein KIP88_00050 [Bradyrhizobium sp. SRL28]|uniref:hypothetical protein n=1 Tax=Bradyrhizobium sp. SRL28 TaxID=2836178 RepID=UPI001BDE44DE|nr:hypothetical protein [Bradyrhizobium sp. SRL28]MBT1508874.1 hypothetical protein [Bradyrhizobium sp. SRL28]